MSGISVPFKKHDAQSIGTPGIMYHKNSHISKFGKAEIKEIKTGIGNKRNNPCDCGSGKKYKKCCLLKNEPKLLENKPDLRKLVIGG